MRIRKPLPRPPRPDIVRPSLEDLLDLSLSRIRYAVSPSNTEPPPIPFPLAESMRWDFFTEGDWDTFGNLESEYGRLTYTLTRYPERGPLASCDGILHELLGKPSVLEAWGNFAPELETRAMEALRDVCRQQENNRSNKGKKWSTKADCVTVPVDYVASEKASEISLQLWRRSLAEVASELATGHSACFEQFLQVHAFLKDPIYGFVKPFRHQRMLFKRLVRGFEKVTPIGRLRVDELERLAAQAAQESAYLSNPLLDKVSLVHFQAHHQLTYINVPLDTLARAEFSVPSHVLEVAEEMLQAAASNEGQACPIVPILVTSRPRFGRGGGGGGHLTPIIDGNHRATAALMLRFLATCPLEADYAAVSRRLLGYCVDHGLGRKWQIDLLDVLRELYDPSSSTRRSYLQTSDPQLLSRFATVSHIPALVVQEEDFHTICKQRSASASASAASGVVVLLHPFHQTLFNEDELPFALPQKAGQTHGRPEAFRILSLAPFGNVVVTEGKDGDGVEVHTPPLKAKLRESMNGLVENAVASMRVKARL
ncbi:hypothetical protein F5Y17DRAFT_201661 [Xylariaceae sp. FL0594]|nr:hypothetical protein F5Y17DRAFT_201661 [Xylariaceae sp. FL0594]